MEPFTYTSFAQQIIFGPGALDRLKEATETFGWRRLLICVPASMRRQGVLDRVEKILGKRLVAVFEGVQPHVPEDQVKQALNLALKNGVEAVIGLGGGSAIGLAKAITMEVEAVRLDVGPSLSPIDQPLVPNIAIPTTYAGSEMTPVYGVTRRRPDGTSQKVTVKDVRVTPKLTIYDPALTLGLPPEMTATTGINALAHCVEAVYAIDRHPLSTAAALRGIKHITQALPHCYRNGADLAARREMFLGAHLAAVSLATVSMGLHHGLCHVLGGSAGVPHGLAHSIMLPHAMRFNLAVVAPQLAEVAEAMDLSRANLSDEAAGEAAAQAIYNLIGQLGIPQRLREVGVAEADLPRLAELALQSKAVQSNPKPVTDAHQAESVYRAAW